MGTDCSTPITLFFLPILKKNMKKCVYGVPCIWCEIRKTGQGVSLIILMGKIRSFKFNSHNV